MNCHRVTDQKERKVFGRTKGAGPTRCNRTARHFKRAVVNYQGRVSSTIFGFCDECVSGTEDPKNWKNDWAAGSIYRLWGTATFVEDAPKPDAMDGSPAANAAKERIKVIMRQRNTEKITLENWKVMFDDILREHPVEEVMKS